MKTELESRLCLLPRFVTWTEYKAMRKAAWTRTRDRILLYLLYSGLRVKDVRQVRVRHLRRRGYLKGSLILVAQSTYKQMGFTIRKESWALITGHIRRESLGIDDFLFRSKKGRAIKIRDSQGAREVLAPISRRHIRYIVNKYARLAAIPDYEKISPMALRYGFAVLAMTKHDKSLTYVERILLGLRHDARRAKMLAAMASIQAEAETERDPQPRTRYTVREMQRKRKMRRRMY